MRIGIDARLWNETGVGRYIRNLVDNLVQIDTENSYVLFVRNPEEFKVQSAKCKIVEANIRWHSLDEQLRFPAILQKENLDLMHFPYFSVPIFYRGTFIVTIHDLIPFQFDTGRATSLPLPLYKAKRLGYKTVLKQAVQRAAKIIAVSEATKSDVVRLLGVDGEKIAVTYEGVDDKLKVKSEKLKVKVQSQKFFLYVGNAYPHKNLDRLLEAHSILISQYPNISLVLVGKEDYFYKRLKEKVAQLGLGKHVIFYEQVTDEELSHLYRNAQALAVPSLIEGFGLPPLEAMANNCLVLASDIAALREVCGEAALYFNPYDIHDIAEKMNIVCFNDLNHFSKNKAEGLRRAKNFSWKKMAEETLQIYEEVGRRF